MTIARRKAIDHHRARTRRPEPRERAARAADYRPRDPADARTPSSGRGRRAPAQAAGRPWPFASRADLAYAEVAAALECSRGGGPPQRPRGPEAPARSRPRPCEGGAMSGSDLTAHRARAARLRRRSPPRRPPRRVRRAGARADAAVADVAYATVDTPLGRDAGRVDPAGAWCASGFRREELRRGPRQRSPCGSRRGCSSCPARIDEARRELDEYFAGDRRDFDLSARLAADRRRVRRAACSHEPQAVPYGEAITYAEAAAQRRQPPRLARGRQRPAARTRSPSWFPATAWSAPAARLGNYGGGPGDEALPARPRGLAGRGVETLT